MRACWNKITSELSENLPKEVPSLMYIKRKTRPPPSFDLIDSAENTSLYHSLSLLQVSANFVVHVSYVVSCFTSSFLASSSRFKQPPKHNKQLTRQVSSTGLPLLVPLKLKYFSGFQATNQQTHSLVSGEIISSKAGR